MTLKGMDLVITNSSGTSKGYVLALDKQFGEPVVHSKSAPNVPLNTGSSSPAQAGGQYDVRDSDGDKAISHIDWTQGAGQRSLDSDSATPYKFWESKSLDISRPGQVSLLNGCTYTATPLVTGPVFSAMGYFWLGTDYLTDDTPQVAHSVLMHSQDGVTWVHPTITASPAITGLITSFASDGSNIYFGVATGANKGIWRGVYSGTWTFTKYGSSGTTEEVRGLAFNGGQLFASVLTTATPPVSRVAQVDRTTGVISPQVAGSKLSTPVMFNPLNHIALVSAANSVYWVVSQSNKSFIYKITYEPDTGAMMTEQYMEMPTGFIATCALGYLSSIYVGGYFESQTAGVGKGAVYVCADGYSAPLFELGELPENTPIPSDTMNDNRVNAICEAVKDLYVSTNRGVYRWDIDGGGFSHAYDLNSGGAGVSTITWNPGSEYSYDGTDMTNPAVPGPEHGRFPSKWTQVDTRETGTSVIGVVNINPPNTITNDGPNCWFYLSSGSATSYGNWDWSNVTALEIYNVTQITWVGGSTTLTNLACSYDPVTTKMTLTGRNVLNTSWPASGPRVRATTGLPFFDCNWDHTGGIAYLRAGANTTLTTVPDGADALNNATGSTMEIRTGAGFAGTTQYTVQDGAKIVRFNITRENVMSYIYLPDGTVVYQNGSAVMIPVPTSYIYMKNKFESVICTGYTTSASYDWSTGVWSYAYRWTWVGSGNWYWYGESGLPVAAYGGDGRMFIPANPVGEHVPYGLRAPTGINVPHPCTVRCTVLGNVAELSVNDDQNTKLSMSLASSVYNDATKRLTLMMNKGAQIDSWSLNSKDGYPAQNEVEVLGYAGIAYNKGRVLSPYVIPSDSTSGVAMTNSDYAESGWVTQSETSFHSGTLKKDFRSLDVAHSAMPYGCSLEATAWIDGEAYILTGVPGSTKTRFALNRQGYSIKTSLRLVRGADVKVTPTIKAVNVMWDFVKIKKHQYNLHCSEGAKNGTWRDDPQEAISFLYAAADQRATFEDAFVGQYEGTITDVSFLEANPSTSEGYSGVLKVIVRESDA